jgi:S-adenosylmethionine:tRNA ribosyltransferase-isomerase
MIDLEDFDFSLDESRIARYPSKERDSSQLMVLNRKTGSITIEPFFRNIEKYLLPGDRIFFNETKVSARRVYLRAGKDGIRIHESVFLEEEGSNWLCLIRNSKKLKMGDYLVSPEGSIKFRCEGKKDQYTILQPSETIGEEFFEREGNLPIPPYLKREAEELDKDRYQTIFAKTTGSVAAPTAGLHMSNDLKIKLESKGVEFFPLHLRIGFGTFQPLTEDNLKEKKLHKEEISIPAQTIAAHKESREQSRRRIALGTTTLRALEAMHRDKSLNNNPNFNSWKDWIGETDIFLSPGDQIDTIDGIITNFHLPKSSLILLVSAFAGVSLIREAYQMALEKNFRFFSYGDAMLIL